MSELNGMEQAMLDGSWPKVHAKVVTHPHLAVYVTEQAVGVKHKFGHSSSSTR